MYQTRNIADLLQTAPPEAWAYSALCAQVDPELFFPEKGGTSQGAKRICASCDVSAQCLQYALDNDERFGVWGGLSERERRKIKRSQCANDSAAA